MGTQTADGRAATAGPRIIAPRIIALWAAPRSRSTAFFRMMAQRGDFAVVHEPFSYLAEFGETKVGAQRVTSGPAVLHALRELAGRMPVFVKDTTDERYPDLLADERFLSTDAAHTFIIRHPLRTIASYYEINPAVRCHQIGFEAQYEIYARVERLTGRPPAVIDADELIAAPAAMVSAYCECLAIPYRPEALSWNPGTLAEWQPSARWHEAVSASSGFSGDAASPARPRIDVRSHPVLRGYLDHHLPFYQRLRLRRLRPGGSGRAHQARTEGE